MPPPRSTIFALSSGRLPAAIAVVRISGLRAGDALKVLAGKIPEPRKAAFARVRDPETNEPIDEALALWFPGPNSETGEDVAELQLHGGRAVVEATFRALSRMQGLRPAEAGEFTRRGFENGKLDLTAVEGLADLVSAETEAQRRQALRQMQGALAKRADAWREKLIKALALAEAGIDFSDEGDVPDDLLAPARAIAAELEQEIAAALADNRRGERLREGFVVAIAGPPNAGKSTLLNRLAQREAAIVSPYAGTTRDVIEVHLDLNGLPVTLLDTAGIRETSDPVELEGVRRAQARAATADLVLWVVDASESGPEAELEGPTGGELAGSNASTGGRTGKSSVQASAAAVARSGFISSAAPFAAHNAAPSVWIVRNKADLIGGALPQSSGRSHSSEPSSSILETYTPNISHRNEYKFCLSAKVGTGLAALIDALAQAAERALSGSEPSLVTRERQRAALEGAVAALHRAQARSLAEDLFAEELRLASRALARLTGRVDVEDVLDVIFRDFCVGK